MKNILFTLCFILSNFLFAQKITFGPEIGLNLISIENTEIGNDYQLGYHFGSQVNYHFSNHFSIGSGLFLSQKKKKYSFIDTSSTFNVGGLLGGLLGGGLPDPDDVQAEVFTTTTGIVKEMYLEIPLTAKYEIYNINFFAGGYVGFLLDANRKQTSISEDNTTDVTSLLPGPLDNLLQIGQDLTEDNNFTEITTKEGLTTTDVGLIGGIGYRANHLSFNLTHSYGLLDYRSVNQSSNIENHQITRFSIVYLFGINLRKNANTDPKTVRHL